MSTICSKVLSKLKHYYDLLNDTLTLGVQSTMLIKNTKHVLLIVLFNRMWSITL